MKIKSDICEMAITVNAVEFARILALASHNEVLRNHLKQSEAKIQRMRAQLTQYQSICERKRASVAGATVEPQANETNADDETFAVSLTIETEGRVSGGERAIIETNMEANKWKAKK